MGTFLVGTATTAPTSSSTATPTRTSTPTPTPTSTAPPVLGQAGTTTLSVMGANGANFGVTTFNTSNVAVTGAQGGINDSFSIKAADARGRTLDIFSIAASWPRASQMQVGDTYGFSGFFNSCTLTSGTAEWFTGFTSGASNGNMMVASINGDQVVFNVQNLVLGSGFTPNTHSARGTLTLNGTIIVKLPAS